MNRHGISFGVGSWLLFVAGCGSGNIGTLIGEEIGSFGVGGDAVTWGSKTIELEADEELDAEGEPFLVEQGDTRDATDSTTTIAKSGNVDPLYNISCEPGSMVLWLPGEDGNGGFAFLCESSAFTRAYELQKLREQAVVDEVAGIGFTGWALWALNSYLDDAPRVAKYQGRVAKYQKKADKYFAKAAEYEERSTNRRYSASQRRRYARKAEKYEEKAHKYLSRANEYRDKIDDIAADLDRRMPNGVSVEVLD